jgi:hypothetical protein
MPGLHWYKWYGNLSRAAISLTEGGIVEFILIHLSTERPELPEFQFLCLDSIPEPPQSLIFGRHLVMPRLLLFQEAKSLFLCY